jgi:hypothetical protein
MGIGDGGAPAAIPGHTGRASAEPFGALDRDNVSRTGWRAFDLVLRLRPPKGGTPGLYLD